MRTFKTSKKPHLALSEVLEARRLLATVMWDGGGDNFYWDNPLNWAGDVVPGPGDDVVISRPETNTVRIAQFDADPVEIRSLVTNNQLWITGIVRVETTAAINAPLRLIDGKLEGGVWDVTDGEFTCDSTPGNRITNCDVIGEIRLAGGAYACLRVDADVTFDHIRLIDQYASLGFAPGTVVHGRVTLESQDSGIGAAAPGGTITFAPDADIRAATGSRSVLGTGTTHNAPITLINQSSIQVLGRLRLEGNWNNAPGVIAVSGVLELAGTFPTAHLGTITRNGGSVRIVGTLDNTGATFTLNQSTGIWRCTGTILGGNLQFADGQYLDGGRLRDVNVLSEIGAGYTLEGSTRFPHALLTGWLHLGEGYVLRDPVTMSSQGLLNLVGKSATIGSEAFVLIGPDAYGFGGNTGNPGEREVVNHGTVELNGNIVTRVDMAYTLQNHGTVRVLNSRMRFFASSVNAGTVAVNGSGVIEFLAAMEQAPGAQFGGDGTIFLRDGTHTFGNSLQPFTGKLSVRDYATALFDADQEIGFHLELSGGTVTGSGDLTAIVPITLTSGTLSGSGKLIVPSGTTITLRSFQLARTIENHGTTALRNSPRLLAGGRIDNFATGVVHALGAFVFGTQGANSEFNNLGTFNVDTVGGAVSFNDVAVNNYGAINLLNGDLSLLGGGVNTMPIVVPQSRVLRFGGNFFHSGTTAVSGPGNLEFISGTHDFTNSALSSTGIITVERSTLHLAGPLSTSWLLIREFGIARIDGDVSVPKMTLDIGATALEGSGDVTITQRLDWFTGEMRGAGKTILANGAVGLIQPLFAQRRLARTLDNNGETSLNGGTLHFGDGINAGVINNLTNGLFTLFQNATLLAQGSHGHAFNNDGHLRIFGSNPTLNGIPLHNRRIVTVQQGALHLLSGGTQTAAGTFNPFLSTQLRFAGQWDHAPGSSIIGGPVIFDGGTHRVAKLDVSSAQFQSAAAVTFTRSPDTDVLSVVGQSRVSLEAGADKVWQAKSISISADSTIDLADNAMVLDYTSTSPIANIQDLVQTAYNSGAWNGNGITSSLAAAAANGARAIGFGESADLFLSFPANFVGVAVDNTAVLLRYTIAGDANLDTIVNLTDFNRLAANIDQTPRYHSQGDFNYDGLVNLADFNILAAHFGSLLNPSGTLERKPHVKVPAPSAVGRFGERTIELSGSRNVLSPWLEKDEEPLL